MTETKTTNLIEAKNLSFSYENDEGSSVCALKNINLEIKRGSFTAIVGPNGSGKSTLAKNMNALVLPSEGEMLIDGISTNGEEEIWKLRKKVGMVFQNPDNQLVSSVVEDDVAFGPENLGIEPSEIRQIVDESLKAVGMYEFRKKGPHLLSGGQKQRIAIAGILAMNPDCIVFDEPTAMLDPTGRAEILDIICRLHEEGKTIILITHFMEEAVKADRIIVMNKGSIEMDGQPNEIFSNAQKLKDLKLSLPFAAELSERLKQYGLNIPGGIIRDEELINAICSLK